MIIEVEGDILLSQAQVIVHGVAANDPMNQGLAKSLHEKLPTMHKEFHRWCHVQHPDPGTAWMWKSTDGVSIVNLITQEGGYGHGGRPGKATVKNVSHALRELKKLVKKEKFESIALPRLATGVGGLEWKDVSPHVKEQLEDVGIPVYVYSTYRKGEKAKESR
ncbi:macro domain-containing protein [Pseudomonadota bacterium]